MRDALNELDVAAHSFYHEEAPEEDAAQEAFAFLTLLADRDDRVSLRFLLGLTIDENDSFLIASLANRFPR
jgi:hypothetical protein